MLFPNMPATLYVRFLQIDQQRFLKISMVFKEKQVLHILHVNQLYMSLKQSYNLAPHITIYKRSTCIRAQKNGDLGQSSKATL